MLYFRIAVIAVSALGLLAYTLLFERRYFWRLLVIEVICSGFLSFHIFYHIGSYKSLESDADLIVNAVQLGDGLYSINMEVIWKVQPEIFGFNGDNDMLVVRYRPEFVELVSADRRYREAGMGKPLVKIPEEYAYSKMDAGEMEIGFSIDDGCDDSTAVTVCILKPGSSINIFFLHDYKIPLESTVFWEKRQTVNIK